MAGDDDSVGQVCTCDLAWAYRQGGPGTDNHVYLATLAMATERHKGFARSHIFTASRIFISGAIQNNLN